MPDYAVGSNAADSCDDASHGSPMAAIDVAVGYTNAASTYTGAYRTCKAGDSFFWRNDPMHVYQNSVMFNGFGAGNCWYMGRDANDKATNKHIFRCNNIGAVAANTELSLAFQFTVRNQGKSINASGKLATVAKTMDCDLTISTRQSANVKKPWFTQTISNNVDGNTDTTWAPF